MLVDGDVVLRGYMAYLAVLDDSDGPGIESRWSVLQVFTEPCVNLFLMTTILREGTI